MSRLTRDGTAEPVSRDQILRHARGQGNIHFPCSADHEQDWQPYPVDPYSAIFDDHTYIHTYILHDLQVKNKCDVVCALISYRIIIGGVSNLQKILRKADDESTSSSKYRLIKKLVPSSSLSTTTI